MRHIEIVTCDYCGTKFEARAKTAKYCSHHCANSRYMDRRRKKKKEEEPTRCHYNQWVSCDKRCNCEACGWNPKVAEERTAMLREKMMEVKA